MAKKNDNPPAPELNYLQAAAYLGIHHRILRRARAKGQINPTVYGYKLVRFSIGELEDFRRRRRACQTGGGGGCERLASSKKKRALY